MNSRSRLLFVVLLLIAGVLAMPWAAAAQEPVTSRLKLSIGGYIKAEFIYQNEGGVQGSPTGTTTGSFLRHGPRGTAASDDGALQFSTQETRFNFTLTAPDWRGIKPTAFFEADFFGAGGVTNNPPGAFRIRHAFFRLSGEGLGGSWNTTVGRTWEHWSFAPIYSGSTLQFAGGGWLNDRSEQIRFTHNWKVLRDLTWENAVAVSDDRNDAEVDAEVPMGSITTRVIWSGWQGFQGGARRPLNAGFGAAVGRTKQRIPNQTNTAPATISTETSRSISNVRWAMVGGIFIPILPGTSPTDRTWALSAMAKGGYAEGIANMSNAGWLPLVGATTGCANQHQWAGLTNTIAGGCAGGAIATNFNAGAAVAAGNLGAGGGGGSFLQPMQANPLTGAPILTRTGTTAGFMFTPGGLLGGGLDAWPKLQMLKSAFWDASGQLYLPWNFWISSGMRAVHWTNTEDASPASLVVKRYWNTWATLFYDMTPNIRWGLEYMHYGTNYRNSLYDAGANIVHLAGYFFF